MADFGGEFTQDDMNQLYSFFNNNPAASAGTQQGQFFVGCGGAGGESAGAGGGRGGGLVADRQFLQGTPGGGAAWDSPQGGDGGDVQGGQGIVEQDVFPAPTDRTLSPEYEQQLAQASAMLAEVAEAREILAQQLADFQDEQQRNLKSCAPDFLQAGEQRLWDIGEAIQQRLVTIQQVTNGIVLEPHDLYRARNLGQALVVLQYHAEVLKQEFQALSMNLLPSCTAALVITEQPIPNVVFKGKQLDEPYVVHLVTGANWAITGVSAVKVALIAEDAVTKNSKVKTPITNDEAALDAFQRDAVFHQLALNISTRMNMVHLKFGIQLSPQSADPIVLETDVTTPLIVITNESQWVDAASKLIVHDAFGLAQEVNWPLLANVLQHHFYKITKQTPERPSRRLEQWEMHRYHQKFFGLAETVTVAQVKRFWKWFGCVLQTIHFKRHIQPMWANGLIYGVISKEECNSTLEPMPQGTFVIRFSDSSPGQFSIAYVSDDQNDRVKHYLVKSQDTSSYKSLAEFIRQKAQFQHVLQLDVENNVLLARHKDDVFLPYYSKSASKSPSAQSGYVVDL